jgi:SAM-dependent methyltransferase
MTQAENTYQHEVFLDHLRHRSDREVERIWHEHQQMQLSFLQRRGLRPSSTVLDLGCGPMRLGSVLIPLLSSGWYYGQDLNPDTLAYGEEVLRQAGIAPDAPYTLMASERFDLSAVDRPVDIAFANSLFSHLNLNSIVTCLLQLRQVLQPRGVFYATFFALDQSQSWLTPQRRDKWGHTFDTYANQDPYHYSPSLLKALARDVGYYMDLVADFGHPTQTMARFRRRWR